MAQGMRFACQPGCTQCCRQQGFVYLTEQDLIRAAEFLRMRAADFERRYVYRTRRLLRLRTPRAGRCHFLNEDGCSIHPAKPTQCRAFPFWPELVDSRREWNKTGSYCPGIGKGPLIQIEAARAEAAEMRAGYPGLYNG
ncbi:MAG: YkgJ family cysteine cluster protein [Acidobacteriia bacterium]|nr:YkgJ family cysteine cluster protein [Terriglobia bacterium]